MSAAQHVNGGGAGRHKRRGWRRLQTARLGRDGLEGVVPPEYGISSLDLTLALFASINLRFFSHISVTFEFTK
jgi:hypothetical protein